MMTHPKLADSKCWRGCQHIIAHMTAMEASHKIKPAKIPILRHVMCQVSFLLP